MSFFLWKIIFRQLLLFEKSAVCHHPSNHTDGSNFIKVNKIISSRWLLLDRGLSLHAVKNTRPGAAKFSVQATSLLFTVGREAG
jgi:hypothetical protein